MISNLFLKYERRLHIKNNTYLLMNDLESFDKNLKLVLLLCSLCFN